MVSMYLLVLFLIFFIPLIFQPCSATSTQLKSSSQRASTTSTLSSLAIRLARWIWRKVHHGQQYLIFLPLSLVLEHQCFIFFFFSFWVFNSGRLLLEHQRLKKCLNWTLDWMCGTQLFMHVLCYLQIFFLNLIVNCDINIWLRLILWTRFSCCCCFMVRYIIWIYVTFFLPDS